MTQMGEAASPAARPGCSKVILKPYLGLRKDLVPFVVAFPPFVGIVEHRIGQAEPF